MNRRIYTTCVCILIFLSLLIIHNSCSNEKRVEYKPLNINTDKEKVIVNLERTIPHIMEKALIPGLSIAVIRDGKLFWGNSFGVKNINTQDSVTAETVFEAASQSKPVFSYAVMKMVERGELEIDKPLVEYASDEYIEKYFLGREIVDERFKKITTRMILSHRTGFPNWREQNPLTINFEPGEKFSYSGEGFGYLQKVVEKITCLPLNEFMKKEVFKPLSMTHSSYIWQEHYEQVTSLPHDRMMDVGEKSKFTVGHAAASLHTTASDFAKFIMAIMNHAGLRASTIDSMLSPQVIVDPEEMKNVEWGLGFGLQRTRNGISYWHWGDNGNFKCFFIAFPDQRIGVVYFTNSYYGLAVRRQIVQLAIGGYHPVMNSGLLINYGDVDSPWMEFIRVLVTENVDAALDKFNHLREKFSATDIIPEYSMNNIGYALMRKKQYASAIKIFQLNVETYPDSWNVYDSLGEAFMEYDDKELAIKNYMKSLELNSKNENAAKMLKKLK